MNEAQKKALQDVIWRTELWWHDIPSGTRDVLLRNGWIQQKRSVPCITHGFDHPGYMEISEAGMSALKATDPHGELRLGGNPVPGVDYQRPARTKKSRAPKRRKTKKTKHR